MPVKTQQILIVSDASSLVNTSIHVENILGFDVLFFSDLSFSTCLSFFIATTSYSFWKHLF